MKVPNSQLLQHLKNKLEPIYLVTGDELLLVEEAATTIRSAARLQGYERTIVTVEGNDWGQELHKRAHSLSFFSEKQIIEINLCHLKINQAHGKILEEYAFNIPRETILLILTTKCDAKVEKSKWYQAIDKHGVIITCWPIPLTQLPQWIMERAKKNNLNIQREAAMQLADLVEGNLSAAAQEIEKLSLLQPRLCDTDTIESIATDHSQFDIFNLVDSTLMGDHIRLLRIIDNLYHSDVPPTLILWALTRELRTLAEMRISSKKNTDIALVLTQFRVWEKRKPYIRAFLERHSIKNIWKLLTNSAKIDRIIKGVEVGNIENELKGLALSMAGSDIIKL